MHEPTASTVYCPECGTQNDEHLTQCISCDSLLDPEEAAKSQTPPPRPMHWRTFGLMAGLSAVLLLAVQLAGLGFSMEVVQAPVTTQSASTTLRELVDDDVLSVAEARRVLVGIEVAENLRRRMAEGELSGEEQMDAQKRLRPADQSVVLGFGSVTGLAMPLLLIALAAIVAAVVSRARRLSEILYGALAGLALQLLLWIAGAEFSVGAVLGGEMVLIDSGLGFAGAPIMLLGMSMVLSVAAAAGSASVAWLIAEQATGIAGCGHCDHRFSLRPQPPSQCPKCKVPLPRGPKVRYRSSDEFLGELGAAANPVTRASAGTEELLCVTCAKTYAADSCPVHPHEPLLDPTREEVKYQLLDLDTQAGTQRFARWTSEGLGVDDKVGAPAPSGPLLCMACAKTYETEACPTHPHEPLLDPSSEEVRLQLAADDDQRRAKMGTMLMFGAAGIAALLSAATRAALDISASTTLLVFGGVLTGLVAVASVLTPKLAPPRYLRWSGESEVDLDEFGMGAESTLFAPLRRYLRLAKQQALMMVIVVVVGAGLAAALAAAADFSVGGFAFLGGLVAMLGYLGVLSVRETARELNKAAKDAKKAWDDPYAD